MAVGDLYVVKFASWCDGQIGLNVRYYRTASETTGGVTQAELANVLGEEYKPLIKPLMSSAAVFLGCSARKFYPPPSVLASVYAVTGGAGTGAPAVLPTQVSGVITLRTPLASRRNRGRMFVPFPGDDALNAADGNPTTAYVANLLDLGDMFVGQDVIVGGSGTTTIDNVICTPGGTVRGVIASITARGIWGTQRRRGQYGAKNPADIPL